MEYNPTQKGKMVSIYPDLKSVFGENPDDKAIRYIILMYDQKSPLRSSHPGPDSRRMAAAMAAGYDTSDEDLMEQLATFTQKEVREGKSGSGVGVSVPWTEMLDMVSNYLRFRSSRLWTLIVSNEQSFYEYQRKVMTEVTMEVDKDALAAVNVKTKLLESMDEMHRRLDKYYSDLTGGDKSLEDSLIKKRASTPESQAVM